MLRRVVVVARRAGVRRPAWSPTRRRGRPGRRRARGCSSRRRSSSRTSRRASARPSPTLYYLQMVQYYGEHVSGDGRLDSLPAMADLVTTLSPHFTRAYLFSAFALIDAGRRGRRATSCCRRGSRRIRTTGASPPISASSPTATEQGEEKRPGGRQWYQKAAEIPGSPDYLPRLAAALLAKGGEQEKAILMWGQAYLAGDKYARAEGGRRASSTSCPEDASGRDGHAEARCAAARTETMPEGRAF